ncbi:MAG TPA: ATPase, T2SS/T4P/T4SS family, partial [Coriobacteriia bacterium]
MTLLQRVARAQQGADIPNAGTTVPVEPAAPPKPARVPAREELLREVRVRLQEEVIRAFDALREVSGAADARSKVEGIFDRVIDVHGFAVTRDERLRLIEEVADDLTGFGPLEPLLRDETITEVMVNGPSHIYIERGGKIQRVDSVFLSDEHVLRIIDRIITPMGRRIDESSPRVDARLPDGSRVNAIIKPLSLVGPVITVRKFAARPFTVDDLVRFGTATAEMFDFLKACIEARLNIFVSG